MVKAIPQEYESITEKDITTVLAEDISFKGSMKFKTSLMVKGKFEGDIESEGILLIGENANITASIKTNILINKGNIKGNVQAEKSIVLCSTSNHSGDLCTPNLIIENGAVFNGMSVMKNTKSFNRGAASTEQQDS